MPGIDWFPGISQLKSGFQLLTGDVDGAAQTQINFMRECPVVSQVTSTVQVIAGDTDGALETQKRCLSTVNNVANGIPVVGHVKGVIHHAVGDHEGGNVALNAATRTTVVMGAGAGAAIASGGLAAIPAGLAAATAYDTVDSVVSDQPKGGIAALANTIENPNAGNFFDLVAGHVGDAMTGYAGGNLGTKIANNVKLSRLEAAQAAKNEQLNAGLFPEKGAAAVPSGDIVKLGNDINALTSEINQIKGSSAPQYLYDPKANKIVVEYPKGSTRTPVVPNQPKSKETPSHQTTSSTTSSQPSTPRTVRRNNGYSNLSSPRPRVYQWNNVKSTMNEDGSSFEEYSDEITCKISDEEKKRVLDTYRKAVPQSQTVTGKNRYTRIRNSEEEQYEKDLNNQDPFHKLNFSDETKYTDNAWLHLPMPRNFGYTGAGLLNCAHQGFLHTFIRHWDQWMKEIPSLRRLMDGPLRNLKQLLENVQKARNRSESEKAKKKLEEALKEITKQTNAEDIFKALYKAQWMIYGYLRTVLSKFKYLGEGVNNNGLVQVYFQTPGGMVLVLCFSSELFPSIDKFGDGRPIRALITAFFITKEDLRKKEPQIIWKN